MKNEKLAVDPVVLREEVKNKYRDVAVNPSGDYRFHTGKLLAGRLGGCLPAEEFFTAASSGALDLFGYAAGSQKNSSLCRTRW
jgi:hypothetical protein